MSHLRYIVAGWLVDGTGAEIRRNVYLAVEAGTITAIGAADEIPADASTEIVDLSYCTLLPPLVDCSLYLDRSPSLGAALPAGDKQAGESSGSAVRSYLRYCHAHGVLGVADGGGGSCSPRDEKPEAEYPVTIRRPVRTSMRDSALSVEDAPAGDYLRIGYTGSIEGQRPMERLLDAALLKRVLASRGNLKAVVVANGRQQVKEALEAGCDAIEQGYDMGEENIREMARRGVLWIPSVLLAKNALDGSASGGDVCCRFSQRYVAPGKALPGAEAHWKSVFQGQLAQLRLAREWGGQAAVGTGAGTMGILHGESVAEEMRLFGKAGYSLAQRINCATEVGARFFNMDSLGALAEGKPATFLVTRGTVQLMPRKLSYLEGIYIDGRPCPVYRKHPC